jgi:SWI/SNF-related matrix-associated actin-dependent regulator 1 of chromatin subfamily A
MHVADAKGLASAVPSSSSKSKSQQEPPATPPRILFTITSYDIFTRVEGHVGWHGVVIADESHSLKSGVSKRCKLLQPVLKKAKRCILLSGTPMLSKPIELYPQICCVAPKLFPNKREFCVRYCNGRNMPWGFEAKGATNQAELNMILSRNIMIRRLKKDVLTELPDKQRQQVFVDIPAAARKEIAASLLRMESLSRAAEEDAQARALHQQALNEVVRATGRAKIPAVVEFLTDIIEEGAKMLVFAHHLEVLDAMEAAVKAICSSGTCAYMRIDGSTDQSKRAQMVNDFQQQDHIRVALLGITAMSTGVTLTAATTVVFAELHWTPGVMMQAEDRAHRIGQCCCVNVKYIVCKGTADDFMWTAFKRRLSVVSSVCNGDDTGVELQGVTETTRSGGAAASASLDTQV